TPENSPKASEV
ncbi:hypothetical protein SLEP1_g58530, partial [Rubroshorea leprosula]